MMVDMAAVEVWFEGGPAAGRCMPVEADADGRLPVVVDLERLGRKHRHGPVCRNAPCRLVSCERAPAGLE